MFLLVDVESRAREDPGCVIIAHVQLCPCWRLVMWLSCPAFPSRTRGSQGVRLFPVGAQSASSVGAAYSLISWP